MSQDPLYTETQVSFYLGNEDKPFPIRTLQRWRLEGNGPIFIKMGKSVRYRQSDLNKYLSNCSRQSTSDNGGAANDR